ncbi:MAG: flippase-like domain-containing protein [Balneolales bacterium]|nr:flippase-like domain-containing protein [Balneolales bacterium]
MNKTLRILIGVAIAGAFLWLAFKNVEFEEIVAATEDMSWGWVFPFTLVTMLSYFIRAERWRMLFDDKENLPHRSTLFTGVMLGYFTNIALARVGEITRPVYVARQIGESNSKLIGTVFLERFVDIAIMLIITVLVVIFLISDTQILSNLLGVDVTDPTVYLPLIKTLSVYGAIGLAVLTIGVVIIHRMSKGEHAIARFFEKVKLGFKNFGDGLLAIRGLDNWPLFVFYSIFIWACYITMTYIPFYMFDLPAAFGLTYVDAIILTMVSAVGIAIPTPGGIGSYHLFITQAMLIFYAIPEATGLAFATIAHAATIILVAVTTPVMLVVEKRLAVSREKNSK